MAELSGRGTAATLAALLLAAPVPTALPARPARRGDVLRIPAPTSDGN